MPDQPQLPMQYYMPQQFGYYPQPYGAYGQNPYGQADPYSSLSALTPLLTAVNPAAGAAVSLMPAALGLIKAYQQQKQIKELEKIERPTYEMPEAIKQQLNQSKYLASMSELPGQNLMEAKLAQNTSKGIAQMQNASANAADLSSNIAKLYGAQNEGIQNIGLKATQNYLNQQGQLRNVLSAVGQYQDKEFDYNKNQPYDAAKAAESALRYAAWKNVSSSVKDLSAAGQGYMNYKNVQNAYNQQKDQQQEDYLKKTGWKGIPFESVG